MTPRFVTLCIYPLLIIASIFVIMQCRRLAKAFPSTAWTFKMQLMFGFALWQVYGMWQSYWFASPTWWGVLSFSGQLAFLIGLSVFDGLLLNSYSRLRKRIATRGVIPPTLITEQQEDVAQAIRHTVKPELLNEPE